MVARDDVISCTRSSYFSNIARFLSFVGEINIGSTSKRNRLAQSVASHIEAFVKKSIFFLKNPRWRHFGGHYG